MFGGTLSQGNRAGPLVRAGVVWHPRCCRTAAPSPVRERPLVAEFGRTSGSALSLNLLARRRNTGGRPSGQYR